MPRRVVLASGSLFVASIAMLVIHADEPKPRDSQPLAMKRVPWTTSKVRGSPDPPAPFRVESPFPRLKFDEPIDITSVPGNPRLFVTERFGRIFSFKPDRNVEKPDLLIDLNEVYGRTSPKSLAAYGFAVHPKQTHVFITVVPHPEKEEPLGTRVSRFNLIPGDPPRCDPKSEQVIIEWPSGGHNGGALEFGPDGFLYVATGDSSGIADQYLTGQNLSVLPGKILRLDVDRKDGDKHYAIPPDNPFVMRVGARPEIWAYGLRQPWKFSFDRATGDFWCGNVGQDLWEQIYLIEKGGNYGWSVQEGSHLFRPERERGPTPILLPVVEHDHANFRSITGGFICRSQRLKELVGEYVYGDYDTGRVWAFKYDRVSRKVSHHRELVDTNLRLIDFGEGANGELYLLDHMTGRISWLVSNIDADATAAFPRKLSETGLFASTRDHSLATGVLPYSVIAPQWVDGATKERFFGLPGESKIDFEAMLYPFAQGAPPGWKFPDGTVIGETLSLDTVDGRRRLETRILHHERLVGEEGVGDQYWQGYTYIWNDTQTDADLLVDPQGRDRTFLVRDPKAPEGKRSQTWHFHSRTECTVCHNMAAKYAVGMHTAQMNRDHDYGGVVSNQLTMFDRLGLFSAKLPSSPAEMPRLVSYFDVRHSVDLRARSYLHANCAHCHRRWGGGNAEFQLLATFEPHEMGIINVRPGHGTFQIPNARLVAPREPYRSVLFHRMSTAGPAHMPRLGSMVVDDIGVQLIHDWIASLPTTGLLTDVQNLREDTANAAIGELRLQKDAPEVVLARRVDSLLAAMPSALRLAQAISEKPLPSNVQAIVLGRAAKSESAEVRDLFERFLPEEQRIKRLGAVIKPEQILAMTGDAERGRKLFLEGQGVQCRNCHRVGGKGIDVGPDLDGIGKKYNAAAILDNILNPSRLIDPKYLTYLCETKKGQAYTGLLVSRDSAKVVLKESTGKRIEIAAGDVDVLVPQQKSLMPELLLRDLTAEQVADLTAFLGSLK